VKTAQLTILSINTLDDTDNAPGPAPTLDCLHSDNKFIAEGHRGTPSRSTSY